MKGWEEKKVIVERKAGHTLDRSKIHHRTTERHTGQTTTHSYLRAIWRDQLTNSHVCGLWGKVRVPGKNNTSQKDWDSNPGPGKAAPLPTVPLSSFPEPNTKPLSKMLFGKKNKLTLRLDISIFTVKHGRCSNMVFGWIYSEESGKPIIVVEKTDRGEYIAVIKKTF